MVVSPPATFMDMIGTNPVMQSLFRKIALVAPRDIKVLIQGERGTGKELVARAIHRLSRRSKGVFKLSRTSKSIIRVDDPICLNQHIPSETMSNSNK